jgi:hypothetical protein
MVDSWKRIKSFWFSSESMFIDVVNIDVDLQLISLKDELNTIKNLTYVLMSTSVIAIALIGYIAKKKPK